MAGLSHRATINKIPAAIIGGSYCGAGMGFEIAGRLHAFFSPATTAVLRHSCPRGLQTDIVVDGRGVNGKKMESEICRVGYLLGSRSRWIDVPQGSRLPPPQSPPPPFIRVQPQASSSQLRPPPPPGFSHDRH